MAVELVRCGGEGPFSLDGKLLDVKLPPSSWREDQDLANQLDSFPKSLVPPLEGRRGSLNGTQYENGLFSSSLPDFFDKKSELLVSYILFEWVYFVVLNNELLVSPARCMNIKRKKASRSIWEKNLASLFTHPFH
jgi:hypothetical protein